MDQLNRLNRRIKFILRSEDVLRFDVQRPIENFAEIPTVICRPIAMAPVSP